MRLVAAGKNCRSLLHGRNSRNLLGSVPSDPDDQPPGSFHPWRQFCHHEVFTRTNAAAASKVMIVLDDTRSRADLALPAKLISVLQTARRNDGSLTILSVDGRGAAPH